MGLATATCPGSQLEAKDALRLSLSEVVQLDSTDSIENTMITARVTPNEDGVLVFVRDVVDEEGIVVFLVGG